MTAYPKVWAIILFLLLVIGCEKSEVEILQSRLENFRNILPLELRQEFDAKNYQTVAEGIDSLLQVAPLFKEKYQSLKHEELIDVFSPQDVVDYYREYFVEKIDKLKKK